MKTLRAVEHDMSDEEGVDMLNGLFGTVNICGQEHDSGHVFKEIDPVAFRCLLAENTRYRCTECDTVHDTEDEAEDCCRDACTCPYCGTEYATETEANTCDREPDCRAAAGHPDEDSEGNLV